MLRGLSFLANTFEVLHYTGCTSQVWYTA